MIHDDPMPPGREPDPAWTILVIMAVGVGVILVGSLVMAMFHH